MASRLAPPLVPELARHKAATHTLDAVSYSKKLSERMREWLVACGVEREGDHKSFHSFRVNVITMLTDEGANTSEIMKIVGHKSAGSDDVHLGYMRELPKLAEVVNRLKWPIDIGGLKL